VDTFRIQPLAENDIRTVVESCGGAVAHPDAHLRAQRGGDFIIEAAVIELKILDEDGLLKSERQVKLAKLFRDEGFKGIDTPRRSRHMLRIGRRAVRDSAACPQMLWHKSAANVETRESATAASGLKEGQQVRLDDVCVGRGHALRQILVDLQRAVLQRLGRQRTCVGERNNLVIQLRDETDHAAIHP
jgi:hypothetical protein